MKNKKSLKMDDSDLNHAIDGEDDLSLDLLNNTSDSFSGVSTSPRSRQTMPKMLIWSILGLLILVVAVVVLKQLQSKTLSSVNEGESESALLAEGISDSNDGSPNIVKPSSDPTASTIATEDLTTSNTTDVLIDADSNTGDNILTNLPTQDDILSAPIPQSEVAIKEEIQRLEDNYARLQTQEQSLEEQLEVAAEIERKKAEQIALLEQRIALLED